MHKGVKPAAQPRTLRTIAEDKGTAPAGFEGATPYVANAGVPLSEPSAMDSYVDSAQEVFEMARSAPASGAPSPFVNVKKGR